MTALVPRLLSLLLVLGAIFSAGCAEPEAADLLELHEVAPRQLEVGDAVEVIGQGLPSGQIERVEVWFTGTIHRPGRAPEKIERVRVQHATPDPDHVSFVVSEALQAAFCGDGDSAVHTTFEGEVVVHYPAAVEGSAGVLGRLKGVVLDVPGPMPRRELLEEARERGRRLTKHLGMAVAPPAERPDRLAVVEVVPGSEAARAGVEVGDLLVRFAGVTVFAEEDLLPPPEARDVALVVQRGQEERAALLSVATFERPPVPTDELRGLVVLSVLAVFLLLYLSPAARLMTWLERRLLLRLAAGRSPKRRGLRVALSTLWAVLRSQSRRQGFGPYLVFAVVTASFVIMPLGGRLLSAELDVGVLYVLSFTCLIGVGLVTAEGRKGYWTPFAALRAGAQLLAAQLPAIAAVTSVVIMAGSLRVAEVIAAQSGAGETLWTRGAWPWHWFVFRHPFTLLLFGALFVTAGLEGHRGAMALAAAEDDVRRQRPPLRHLLFVFVDWANVFILCGLAAALFLGGWRLPGVGAEQQAGSLALQVAGTALFVLKSWTLIVAVIALRRALPRLRLEQLTRIAWRALVPLAFLATAGCGLWWHLTRDGEPILPPSVQVGIGVATFALCGLVIIHALVRVLAAWRGARPTLHVNPFL